MRRGMRFALAALLWQLSSAALVAEPVRPAPKFTFADEVVISRNEALNALLPVDPWGVRKLLDSIAHAKQQQPPVTHRDVLEDRNGRIRVDPLQNPDLNILFQRVSPEAAYDLFQILKQAGQKLE